MTNSTANWAWSGTNVHKRAVLFERQLCLVNDYLKHLAGLADDCLQDGDVIATHLHRNAQRSFVVVLTCHVWILTELEGKSRYSFLLISDVVK